LDSEADFLVLPVNEKLETRFLRSVAPHLGQTGCLDESADLARKL
jgi:hypothetical protein